MPRPVDPQEVELMRQQMQQLFVIYPWETIKTGMVKAMDEASKPGMPDRLIWLKRAVELNTVR